MPRHQLHDKIKRRIGKFSFSLEFPDRYRISVAVSSI